MQASCGPCRGDPWPARAGGGVLADAPAALIESITGEVYDVEGIHDRPRAGGFFGGGAFEPGESIHRDDLNALTPRVGAEASQVVKTCLERPGIISKSRDGPRRSQMGVTSKTTVTFVAVWGVAPHVFIRQ